MLTCTPDFAILQQGNFVNDISKYARLSQDMLGASGDGSSWQKAIAVALDSNGQATIPSTPINQGQNIYYKFVLTTSYIYDITVTPQAGTDVDATLFAASEEALIELGASENDAGIAETFNINGGGLSYLQVYGYSQNGAQFTASIAQEPPSYTLYSDTSVANVTGDSHTTFTISLIPSNGYTGSITVTPALTQAFDGVTITPASATISSGTPATFTISATKAVQTNSTVLNITTSDNDSSKTYSMNVNVTALTSQYNIVTAGFGGMAPNAGEPIYADNPNAGLKYTEGSFCAFDNGVYTARGKVPICIGASDKTTNRYVAAARVTSVIDNGTEVEHTCLTQGTTDIYNYANDGLDMTSLADGVHTWYVNVYDSEGLCKSSPLSTVYVANNPPNITIDLLNSQGFTTFTFNCNNMNTTIHAFNVLIGKVPMSMAYGSTTFDNTAGHISGRHDTLTNLATDTIIPGLSATFTVQDGLGQSSTVTKALNLSYASGTSGTVMTNPIALTLNTASNVTLTTSNTFYSFPIQNGKVYRIAANVHGSSSLINASNYFVWTPDGSRWVSCGDADIYFTAETDGTAVLVLSSLTGTINADILVSESSNNAFKQSNYTTQHFNILEDVLSSYTNPTPLPSVYTELLNSYGGTNYSGYYHLTTDTNYILHLDVYNSTSDAEIASIDGVYKDNKLHVIIWKTSDLSQVFTYDAIIDPSTLTNGVVPITIPFTVPANGNYIVYVTRNGIRPCHMYLSTPGRTAANLFSYTPLSLAAYQLIGSNSYNAKFDAGAGETVTITATSADGYTENVVISLYDRNSNLLKTVTGTNAAITTLSYTMTATDVYYYTISSTSYSITVSFLYS